MTESTAKPEVSKQPQPRAVTEGDHTVAEEDHTVAEGNQTGRDGNVDDALPPGFEEVGCCDTGSFSEIFQIRCVQRGSLYALKRLRPEWSIDFDARRLFEAEAIAGREVSGEHVVRLVHTETEGDRPYHLLEWLDGETLAERLAGGRRLPLGTAVWFARQTAEGLAELQRAGFVHGDVKPENVFITRNGRSKLIDLGFAHRIDQPCGVPDCKLLIGTAEYLAPETLTGESLHPMCKDIYSLGITLFRMLTGRLPFNGENAADILRLQRQAKPPSLRELVPGVPPALAGLVERMLAKQPLRRPTSAIDLVNELVPLELATLPARLTA